MSTPDPKPSKKRMLNPRLLSIAALVLVVLALIFMATPLLRSTKSFQQGSNFTIPGNGQSTPQNGLINPGNSIQNPSAQAGSNLPNRRAVVGMSFLGGITGPIIYFVALLLSLVAAVGMLYTRRWGQVLGIIMAVLYGLLGLFSLLPVLLMSSRGMRNPLSLIIGIVHVVLAIAVIVLASIPARKIPAPVLVEPPATTSA